MITSTDTATARNEYPIFFEGRDGETLLGIVTVPAGVPLGVGVLVLSGGGLVGAKHPNRLSVRMCRDLASLGFHSLRFDWRGVGDSGGSTSRFRIDRPFVEDLVGATRQLAAIGIGRLLVVGTCFGARTALAATTQIRGLEAMFLISPPVTARRRRHPGEQLAEQWTLWKALQRGLRPSVLYGLSDSRRRRTLRVFLSAKRRAALRAIHRSSSDVTSDTETASDEFIAELKGAVHSGIDVVLLYGDRDEYFRDFQCASRRRNDDVLSRLSIEIVPGPVHGFTLVEAQESVLQLLKAWARTRVESATVGPSRDDALTPGAPDTTSEGVGTC